ncbi:hypothetical protein [Bifidobacterium aquikefiricola]|uniref:Uncharacterized protein n=1 Tax=Bifidobacterium aquikefiricola TaxID=3059038 RepID=A0AB39U708_9BIFI
MTLNTYGAERSSLETYYIQNHDLPVAYIDESYNTDRSFTQLYYILTAVIVQSDERDSLREGLVRVVGGTHWHTTKALRTIEGREKTHRLLEYLADEEGSEECVLSVMSTIQPNDHDGEQARRQAFYKLFKELTPEIELFILERRMNDAQAGIDANTKKDAIGAGLCPPTTRMPQRSPAIEPLLWLPDLVCSAYRQRLTGRDCTYFEHVQRISTLI